MTYHTLDPNIPREDMIHDIPEEEKPEFRVAKAEPRLLPGSIASSALLAFILVNKFTDHLPFHRQEKRYERIGAHISRQACSGSFLG